MPEAFSPHSGALLGPLNGKSEDKRLFSLLGFLHEAGEDHQSSKSTSNYALLDVYSAPGRFKGLL